jgi:hypothetical protein
MFPKVCFIMESLIFQVCCENATTTPQTTTSRRNRDDALSGPEDVHTNQRLKVSSLPIAAVEAHIEAD